MTIKEINVRAGRTFNHPTEQYANFRFDLELKAELLPSDDAEKCLKDLHYQAEMLAEGHKQDLLNDIELHQIRQRAEAELVRIDCEPEKIRMVELRIQNLDTNVRQKLQEGDVELIKSWRELIANDDPEAEKQSALVRMDDRIKDLQHEITVRQKHYAEREAVCWVLRSLPQAKLWRMPDKHLYPGHPDHPETKAQYGEEASYD